MRLRELLSATTWVSLHETDAGGQTEISRLCYDSRTVTAGAAFFAIRGHRLDGHRYLPQAVSAGASVVVSEQAPDPRFPVTWVQVSQVRRTLAEWAHLFHGRPSERLQLAGITGTNGKTTTAYLIHGILQQQAPALLMGSIQNRIGSSEAEATLTTPESVDIQRTLAEAVAQHCAYGVMEVSSHALFLQRAYGCRFPVAVFTNLSQDHLDFHPSFDDYFEAKALLFSRDYNPGLKQGVLNGDDPYGRRLARRLGQAAVCFGFDPSFPVSPLRWESTVEGTRLDLRFFDRSLELQSGLIGKHNLYNLMAAATACALLGLPTEAIQAGVAALPYVPGRFEKLVLDTPFTVVIDFAHTPDALDNVLHLAREVCKGRVICLFGAGGDRDRGKRPQMGQVAVSGAHQVIVTSDNPRSEPPQTIIDEIVAGIPAGCDNWEAIPDRREAIRRAMTLAEPGDLVILAGKGHETYQEIQGRKLPFNEREIAREAVCS